MTPFSKKHHPTVFNLGLRNDWPRLLPPLSSINMGVSVSIPLDVIYEIVRKLGEVEDYNTLASTSLTCRAVAPFSRARLFCSVRFLPGADNAVEVELSRLQELDALFTSNPMLPAYVRKSEFGSIQSKLLWFTGELLARVLNSLTQLKIFLITGPFRIWTGTNSKRK